MVLSTIVNKCYDQRANYVNVVQQRPVINMHLPHRLVRLLLFVCLRKYYFDTNIYVIIIIIIIIIIIRSLLNV